MFANASRDLSEFHQGRKLLRFVLEADAIAARGES
jgi:hypothetical protein